MDEKNRAILRDLRQMTSAEAADWIMSTYPEETSGNISAACKLITHLSWKRDDQVRLARYYLRRLPDSGFRPYEAFAKIMPLRRFLAVMKDLLPSAKPDRLDLVLYQVRAGVFYAVRTDEERHSPLLRNFLVEVTPKE